MLDGDLGPGTQFPQVVEGHPSPTPARDGGCRQESFLRARLSSSRAGRRAVPHRDTAGSGGKRTNQRLRWRLRWLLLIGRREQPSAAGTSQHVRAESEPSSGSCSSHGEVLMRGACCAPGSVAEICSLPQTPGGRGLAKQDWGADSIPPMTSSAFWLHASEKSHGTLTRRSLKYRFLCSTRACLYLLLGSLGSPGKTFGAPLPMEHETHG